ncbi:MAG TPA: hypothetical protein VL463_09235 [Kofleriaceae bacterium]|nr:hypothetical protein [Kofleriaceae bacterium]
MGAITGYIGHRSAPAVAEAQPPLAEPAPPPTTVLVPIQPAPSATAAPESQALPPSAIDDSLLTYTADPPRFAHEDHDDLERGHHHHDHDRDDRDEEGDDD